jgi:hypothetical protein
LAKLVVFFKGSVASNKNEDPDMINRMHREAIFFITAR